jgi:hypothetical protein
MVKWWEDSAKNRASQWWHERLLRLENRETRHLMAVAAGLQWQIELQCDAADIDAEG